MNFFVCTLSSYFKWKTMLYNKLYFSKAGHKNTFHCTLLLIQAAISSFVNSPRQSKYFTRSSFTSGWTLLQSCPQLFFNSFSVKRLMIFFNKNLLSAQLFRIIFGFFWRWAYHDNKVDWDSCWLTIYRLLKWIDSPRKRTSSWRCSYATK